MTKIHIPVYKPYIQGNEKKYLNDCIDTTWISSKGKFIDTFENHFATYTGAKHATSVCNGTVAMHLAMLALDISVGDEVIVPTFTYVASANAIKYVGATPVFVDSLATNWQVNPDAIEKAITPKTKAILVVHLYGHPCDMDAILAICKKHNLYLIEDCAEAIGAFYKGKHVGTFGDVATYSFYGNKLITTGEGGMLLAQSEELILKIKHLKNQGVSKDKNYWHDVVGYNYRMTNLSAAIGCAQMENIEKIISLKLEIAANYINACRNLGIEYQQTSADVINPYWMFSVLLPNKEMRDRVMKTLLETHGIETRPTFYPIHTMPMYGNTGNFPVANDICYRGINLPSYPELTKNEVEYIMNTLNSLYR